MSAPEGGRRIREAIGDAGAAGRTALVAYVMAGFPNEADALAAAEAALAAGANLLEVGVPFSDPMADGPTIADAGRASLANGGGFDSALRMVAALRDRGHDQPVLLMSYLNPLVAAGERSALTAARAAGADGLILPDLPAGASPRLERCAESLGLGLSFLVAPNTAPARLETAIGASTGFLYVVPLLGVTGARDCLAHGAAELLSSVRTRVAGRVPVAAGFGISRPDQLRDLGPGADAVIIGSALVAAVRDGGAPAIKQLVRSLAGATSRA